MAGPRVRNLQIARVHDRGQETNRRVVDPNVGECSEERQLIVVTCPRVAGLREVLGDQNPHVEAILWGGLGGGRPLPLAHLPASPALRVERSEQQEEIAAVDHSCSDHLGWRSSRTFRPAHDSVRAAAGGFVPEGGRLPSFLQLFRCCRSAE